MSLSVHQTQQFNSPFRITLCLQPPSLPPYGRSKLFRIRVFRHELVALLFVGLRCRQGGRMGPSHARLVVLDGRMGGAVHARCGLRLGRALRQDLHGFVHVLIYFLTVNGSAGGGRVRRSDAWLKWEQERTEPRGVAFRRPLPTGIGFLTARTS